MCLEVGLRGRSKFMMQDNITLHASTSEICEGGESVIDLPALPVTGIYSHEYIENYKAYDQALYVCQSCGHGQLKNSICSTVLYGESYGFRTAKSEKASKGVQFFHQYLQQCFPNKKFLRVLEFGCNDASLLKELSGTGETLLGVDPVWGQLSTLEDNDRIHLLGGIVESADVEAILGGKPDLVVSQHTMEHVAHPRELLTQLLDKSADEAMFVFEFPCFDTLLDRYRFDQVFHQHLQYYSLQSSLELLKQVGAELIDYTFNLDSWGSLIIVFKKKGDNKVNNDIDLSMYPSKRKDYINLRCQFFQQQMEFSHFLLSEKIERDLYGYGVALMLPVLGCHLKTDFSNFTAILDDDQEKEGLGYINLPVKTLQPSYINIFKSTICLTAIDNRRPILKNILSKNVHKIINPLNVI